MVDRMVRTAMLLPSAYEEVEHDKDATLQALAVVAMVAIAGAVGGGLASGLAGIIAAVVAAIVGWALFALIAYWVGTTLFRGPQTRASWGELLRCVGFAQSPGVLRILLFLPLGIAILINVIVSIWILVAVVIAVRQALDFDTMRAIGTALVAWIIQTVLTFIVFAVL
ncbi:MAG: YIP1 family protein [Dehalococcoidia bacterium]